MDHKLRATGLGGTDMVAILGLSPHRSAIDVWQEKLGQAPTFAGNERTDAGQRLEPVVADWYAEDAGVQLQESPMLRRVDRPWHLGSPDRFVYAREAFVRPPLESVEMADGSAGFIPSPIRGLEIKTHGYYAGRAYTTDEVPDDKRVQVAWYQALTGVDDWELAALMDTHLFRRWVVPRDAEVEAYLLEEAEAFWTKYVQREIPPPPDCSASFKAYVHGRFRTHDAEMVTATNDDLEVVDLYREAKAARDAAAKEVERLQRILELRVAGNAGIAAPDGAVLATWRRDSVGRISHKKVADKLCEAHGVTDAERREIEDALRGEPLRRFMMKG